MSPSPARANTAPQSEKNNFSGPRLVGFKGSVAGHELYQAVYGGGQSPEHHGRAFSMDALNGRAAAPDSAAYDLGGCTYVQSVGPGGEKYQYYFDGRVVIKRDPNSTPGNPRVAWGRHMAPEDLANPDNDIVLGGSWSFLDSPAERVEAVAVPYVDAVTQIPKLADPNATAPTVRGGMLIEAFTGQPR